MKKLLSIFLSISLLSSCSLLRDSLDISQRQSKQLAKGSVLNGDGFSIKVHDSFLYPKYNFPTKGGITLRPTMPLMDGQVFYITPFKSYAKTVKDAFNEWNKNPQKKGHKVKILNSKETTVLNHRAIKTVVEIPLENERGLLSTIIVLKRNSDYLIISIGVKYSNNRSHMLKMLKKDTRNFLNSIKLR